MKDLEGLDRACSNGGSADPHHQPSANKNSDRSDFQRWVSSGKFFVAITAFPSLRKEASEGDEVDGV